VNKDKKPLSETHPELAKQAVGWDPTTVTAGSGVKKKWKCEKGHEWDRRVLEQIRFNSCPYCSGKRLLTGFSDLATLHPEIASEAYGWDPTKFKSGNNKKVTWKCKNQHVYTATINHRATNKNSTGCPYCVGQKVLSGFNDLVTTHPEIASQAFGWDPTTVTAGSGVKKKWKCEKGHEWEAIIGNRVRLNRNCPYCSNQKATVGENDLVTTHPEIASQAFGWDPTTVTAGSGLKKKWKCEKGHEWRADARHRVYGRGCPTCAIYGFDPNEEGWLYFLVQKEWELYQIGITNNPDQRMKNHKKNNWEVLAMRGPMNGHDARDIETSILRFLRSRNACLSPKNVVGKFDGYTESWTIESYKVNNLKELIDKASDAGF
jgi:hypothetical protein